MCSRRLFLLAIALVPIAACRSAPTALAQPEIMAVAGRYAHAASGMVFPEAAGPFRRGQVTRFDVEGRDVGVGYDLTDGTGEIFATVYVSPSTPIFSIGSPENVVAGARAHICAQDFEAMKAAVVRLHPGAVLVEEQADDSTPGTPRHEATYAYEAMIAGREQPARSEAHLTCYVGDEWSVEYRITAVAGRNVRREVAALMAAVPVR
jgi:hypothetical protein